MKAYFTWLYFSYMGGICLPTGNGDTYQGLKATVAGWGARSWGNDWDRPGYLLKIDLDVLPMFQCKKFDNSNVMIKAEHLCAYKADIVGGNEYPYDPCQGDSGGKWSRSEALSLVSLVSLPGPLMVKDPANGGRYTVAGVVSFGHLCAVPGYPGVYARTSTALPFIRDNLKGEQCG